MALPMMPKATAVWLVENTVLTFTQIAAFCGLHELEVQAIADDEVAVGMSGHDPIAHSQLTQAELDRCQADPTTRLSLAQSDIPKPVARTKGARYTPVSKRQDKPDAISWLLRFFPELTDAQIGKLLGTTKPTISSVRERTHWNTPNIRPRNPVELGMCAQGELDLAVDKAKKRVARADARANRAEAKTARETATDSAPAMAGAASGAAVPPGPPVEQFSDGPPAFAGVPVPPDAPSQTIGSTASFVAPRAEPAAQNVPKMAESVTSVFGASTPAPEEPDMPEPTAQDVFGARKPEPHTTPAEPADESDKAAPEQAAAEPQATDEEPAPSPLPPPSGGSEPADETGESGESEPPPQN